METMLPYKITMGEVHSLRPFAKNGGTKT